MKTKLVLPGLFSLALITGCTQQPQTTVEPNQPADTTTQPAEQVSITNGMPATEFLVLFGEPKGQMTSGSKEWFLYDGFQVSHQDGTISDVPENIDQIYADLTAPSTLEKIKEVKISIPAPEGIKAALAKRKAYTITDSQGHTVDHTELVTTGKLTVVEFSVEGSEAGDLIATNLQSLVSEYENVEFLMVDIVEWNSEISKQYHIGSIPDIRVLDAYGNLLAQPITRIEETDGEIDLTRVKEAIEKAL